MDGVIWNVGVVGGLYYVCNFIWVVWVVLEYFRYVFLMGVGVEIFVIEQGLDMVVVDYFYIESWWEVFECVWVKED